MPLTERALALVDFVKRNAHLPAQGSEEWLLQRNKSIGGSQIATILGINKYENMRSLVLSKAGLSKFKKAAPLWFGNLMEHCVEQYVHLRWGSTVVETGSITHTIDCISYSPDGLCVIKKSKLDDVFTEIELRQIQGSSSFKPADELLVLMEFKSPFMRIPIQGEIPTYYVPQPLLGMTVIPIAEVSLFIECVFRFCSISQLFTHGYSMYHYDRKRFVNDPISFGSISVVYDVNNCSQETEDFAQLLKSQVEDYDCIDLGTIQDRKLITALMEHLVDGELTPVYHSMLTTLMITDDDLRTFHEYNNCPRFNNEVNNTRQQYGDGYVGVLPYKMFDVNCNPVFKQEILTDDVVDKVKKVIDLAGKISGACEDERNELIATANSI